MPRIVCMGELLMDLFAAPGTPLAAADCLRPSPGGAPANVAIALARLDADVGFIGRVGADAFGTHLRDLLHATGVDVSQLSEDSAAPTMLALVWSPGPTEQHFSLYHGAAALLRPEHIPRDYVESAAVFVHTSILLASPGRAASMQAARWAHAAGRQVVFDVNLRPALWPDLDAARAATWDAIAHATVVKLNEHELDFLTGTSDPQRGAARILARGPRLCCVSLGAQGSAFRTHAASGHVPTFPVTAVDTTGSGDAFVAGLAYGLAAAGLPPDVLTATTLRDMLRFANACGALAATRLGGINGMPRRTDVDRLLGAAPAE